VTPAHHRPDGRSARRSSGRLPGIQSGTMRHSYAVCDLALWERSYQGCRKYARTAVMFKPEIHDASSAANLGAGRDPASCDRTVGM